MVVESLVLPEWLGTSSAICVLLIHVDIHMFSRMCPWWTLRCSFPICASSCLPKLSLISKKNEERWRKYLCIISVILVYRFSLPTCCGSSSSSDCSKGCSARARTFSCGNHYGLDSVSTCLQCLQVKRGGSIVPKKGVAWSLCLGQEGGQQHSSNKSHQTAPKARSQPEAQTELLVSKGAITSSLQHVHRYWL